MVKVSGLSRSPFARPKVLAALLVVAVIFLAAAAWPGGEVGYGDADSPAAHAPATHAAALQPRPRPRPNLRARQAARRALAAARARRRRALPINVYRAMTTRRLSARVRGVPQRLYVPNSGDGTLDVINPATGRVIRRFTVGSIPHHVTPSWDLRWLYVDNTASSTLTVIAPRTGLPVRTLQVSDPYNLYFTPDGRQAVVVAERYQQLDFRNPHTWRLIATTRIPAAGPDHLDFSADGRSLLISAEWSGRVFRVDVRRHRVTGSVNVGGLPVDVKIAPDGSVYYVANQGRGGVSLIDARSLRAIAFLPTGQGAHGLCVSRDGHLLYVSNRLAGTISVIDFAERRVVARWDVGGSPDMMQISTDGLRLWVSNRFSASVSEIDADNGRVVRTIPVGASPHGLALFPQPGRFSIGHNGVYR